MSSNSELGEGNCGSTEYQAVLSDSKDSLGGELSSSGLVKDDIQPRHWGRSRKTMVLGKACTLLIRFVFILGEGIQWPSPLNQLFGGAGNRFCFCLFWFYRGLSSESVTTTIM